MSIIHRLKSWASPLEAAAGKATCGVGPRKKVASLTAFFLAASAAVFIFLVIPGHAAATTKTPGYAKTHYVLPADALKSGITFCGEKIPLTRRDVSSRVTDQLNFLLMDRRALLMEWFDRMSIFGPAMIEALSEEKVPRDLLYVAVLLSGLSPNARLKSGGVGWWSLGPWNGKKNASPPLWVTTEDWDERRDFVLSTRIASKLLKGFVKEPHAMSWLLAISAFLDGPDKIEALMKKFPGFSYWDLVTPPLSDAFIPQVVALKIIDTHREFYSLQIPALKPASYDVLEPLMLLKDLPLYVAARWCGISPRSLWELNPAVDIGNGLLPKMNAKKTGALLLRVPKGKGAAVRTLLIKEGYIAPEPS
ncbi:MAG: hypothetical protein ACP5LD_09135 [Desulfomonilaceae bacterium]